MGESSKLNELSKLSREEKAELIQAYLRLMDAPQGERGQVFEISAMDIEPELTAKLFRAPKYDQPKPYGKQHRNQCRRGGR